MSTVDVHRRPAIVSRINSSRYLISSTIPRTTSSPLPTALRATPISMPTSSSTSTAARIARKRAANFVYPSTPSMSSTPNSMAPSHSSTDAASTNDVVKLGTIDLSTVIQSISVLSLPQSTPKPRKTTPPVTSTTPPRAPSVPALPQTSGAVATSSQVHPQKNLPMTFRLHIPFVPRPGPRLPLFHPDNKTPLPDISQKPTLIHTGPSPPPARRSSARARKPAAKAMALSLGLASDGSGLDAIDSAITNKDSVPATTGKTKDAKDESEKATKPGRPARADKAAAQEDPDGGEAPPKATTRRAPKRKAALAAETNMDGEAAEESPAPAKRPRRGAAADQTTAATHAPSPLSNEIARGPASPPMATPTVTAPNNSVGASRKRKAETPVNPSSEAASAMAELVASPPPPPLATVRNKVKSKTANGKAAKAIKASSTNKTEDPPSEGPKKRMRSNSSTLSLLSGDEKEKEAYKDAKQEVKVEDDKIDDDEEGNNGDEEGRKRPVNIFVEPLELKPRPRPTYKSHMKRGSTGSVGDGSEKRARKPRKSASGAGARSHSRKDSDESVANTASDETADSPEDVKPDVQSSALPMEIERLAKPAPAPATMTTMIAPEVVEAFPMQIPA